MTEEDFGERLAAVERRLDAAYPEPEDRDEERIESFADRLADLEAAVEAIEGYVGEIERVDGELERRADAALSTVAELEAGADELRADLDGLAARVEDLEQEATGAELGQDRLDPKRQEPAQRARRRHRPEHRDAAPESVAPGGSPPEEQREGHSDQAGPHRPPATPDGGAADRSRSGPSGSARADCCAAGERIEGGASGAIRRSSTLAEASGDRKEAPTDSDGTTSGRDGTPSDRETAPSGRGKTASDRECGAAEPPGGAGVGAARDCGAGSEGAAVSAWATDDGDAGVRDRQSDSAAEVGSSLRGPASDRPASSEDSDALPPGYPARESQSLLDRLRELL